VEHATDSESGQADYQWYCGAGVHDRAAARALGQAALRGRGGGREIQFRDEAVALSRNCLDVAWLFRAVSQDLSYLANGLLDSIDLLLAAPNLAQQLGLSHHAVTISNKKLQRREGLGGEPDPLPAALQGAELPIQLELAEASDWLLRTTSIGRQIQGHSGQFQRLVSAFSDQKTASAA
jgi:hypothetical protein